MNSWFKIFLTWLNRDVSHVINVLLPLLLWLRETGNRAKYLLLENPTFSLNMLSPVCDTSWERERGRSICTHVFSCFHPSRPLGTFFTNFGHCWFGRGSLLVPPTPVRGRRARNRNKNRNTGKCMYDDTEQINNCSFDFWLSLSRPVYTSFNLPTILYALLVSFYTHECFPPDYNHCTSDSAWCSFYTLSLRALWDSLVMSPVTWHGTRWWGPMGIDTLSS